MQSRLTSGASDAGGASRNGAGGASPNNGGGSSGDPSSGDDSTGGPRNPASPRRLPCSGSEPQVRRPATPPSRERTAARLRRPLRSITCAWYLLVGFNHRYEPSAAPVSSVQFY